MQKGNTRFWKCFSKLNHLLVQLQENHSYMKDTPPQNICVDALTDSFIDMKPVKIRPFVRNMSYAIEFQTKSDKICYE